MRVIIPTIYSSPHEIPAKKVKLPSAQEQLTTASDHLRTPKLSVPISLERYWFDTKQKNCARRN